MINTIKTLTARVDGATSKIVSLNCKLYSWAEKRYLSKKDDLGPDQRLFIEEKLSRARDKGYI